MLKKIILLGFTCFFLFSCQKEEEILNAADKTVLVYILGNNSLNAFIQSDLDQMTEGMQSARQTGNLLVYVDDQLSSRLISIEKDNKGIFKEKLIRNYGEQNAASYETMSSVFKEVFHAYPAKNYALFLWSHGDGWLPKPDYQLRWYGQDGTHFLDISEIKQVLEEAPYFDFIFFDDCFMQSVEVAYELRHYTDYIIGSPTETPGPGAPYQVLMNAVYEEKADIQKMIANYYTYYAGDDAIEIDGWPYGAAVSAIKCNELENLANETKKIISRHADEIQHFNPSGVQVYDNRREKAYYDFQDFIQQITTKEEREQWEKALEKAVPFKASTPSCYSAYINGTFPIKVYSGISVYIPNIEYENWNRFYKTYEWYLIAGWNELF